MHITNITVFKEQLESYGVEDTHITQNTKYSNDKIYSDENNKFTVREERLPERHQHPEI